MKTTCSKPKPEHVSKPASFAQTWGCLACGKKSGNPNSLCRPVKL